MIQMVTDVGEIKEVCQECVDILESCIVEEFIKWAEQDDEYLRSNDGFIDRTGNLRSSLGSAVVKNAEIVFMTPFSTVLNGSTGSSRGRQAAENAASAIQKGIAKVMVAGMDYAQYVEDIDSKDVLESRIIQCEREAQGVLERAMAEAEKRWKAL